MSPRRPAKAKPQRPPRWPALAYPAALMAICGLLFFAGLGHRGLWETDEARYAEIAREMVESGDWVTPRLNYVKYFEKPVLTYWLVGLSFAPFYPDPADHAQGAADPAFRAALEAFYARADYLARLTPAAFASLTVLLVYLLGARLWEPRSGFYAGLVLATSLMFWTLAQVLLVDMVLCAGVALAVWGAWELRSGHRRGLYAFWAGCAIGFMTKGLLGPGLPAIAVLTYAVLAGEWILLRTLVHWHGPALFLVLAAPWNLWMSVVNPEYPAYFIQENFGRLLSGGDFKRAQPFWYYLPLMPAALLPWTALTPWALWQAWPGRAWRAPAQRPWLFAAAWAVAPFLFLSASSSKMMHYVLPLLPPLALFMGRPLGSLMAAWRTAAAPAGVRWGLTGLAVLGLTAGAGLVLAPALTPEVSWGQAGGYLLLIPLALCLLSVAVFALRGRAWAALAGPGLAFLGILACAAVAAPRLDDYRSVRDLVAPLRAELKADDLLVSFGDYYQGLPFYAGRRAVVVNNWGELEFGRRRDPQAGQWFHREQIDLIHLMQDPRRRVIALAETGAFERFRRQAAGAPGLLLFEWRRLGDKSLFANRPR
ncbi:MAG: glycosyltransferase family 39 protein [Thermodesulfobacteriota bacterium]